MLSEFESLLRQRSCPVCMQIADCERSFFSWFAIENFSSPQVQAQLRASAGMCRVHARRLLEEIGESHVLTIAMREATAGARQNLRTSEQPRTCPACAVAAVAAERACQLIVGGLTDPANARLYLEHRGMCLPHVLNVARTAESPALRIVCERLLTSLGEVEDGAVQVLAGADPDAARRARWRRDLPRESDADTTIEQLEARLRIDTCPVCLATGWMSRRYLAWLSHDSRSSLTTDPGELCAQHLHDLWLADPHAAEPVLERKRSARSALIRRLLDHLSDPAPPARRGRRPRGDDRLDRAREQFTSPPYCSACHARDGIDTSQLELVVSALGLEPVRRRYEQSHGLCARHASRLSDSAAAKFVRRHLEARLDLLSWEIDEIARKCGWAYRHEQAGPERHACLRALTQIDAAVFEGGPPPRQGEGQV